MSLLEVMIALGIFFMAMFAILSLVSNTLRNAHALQETDIDAGSLASQLMRAKIGQKFQRAESTRITKKALFPGPFQ